MCRPKDTNVDYDAVECSKSFLDVYAAASGKMATTLDNGLGMGDWGVDLEGIANMTMTGYRKL